MVVRKEGRKHTESLRFLNVEMADFMCKSTSMLDRKNEQKDRYTMLMDCIVYIFLGLLRFYKPSLVGKELGLKLNYV